MAPRKHIIYSHPANTDGYASFSLCYAQGEESLALRYRADGMQREEVLLPPVPMLDWIEARAADDAGDRNTARPWQRAARALRIRIREWMRRAER